MPMIRRAALAMALMPALLIGCRAFLDLEDKEYTLDEAAGGSGADASATSASSAGGGQSSASAQGSGGSIPCAGSPEDCATPVPTGWQRVGYAGNRTNSCTAGFTALDLLADPEALTDACSCAADCTITEQPDCSKGAVAISHGTSLNCDSSGPEFLNANPGGCNDDIDPSFFLYKSIKATPPPPIGGACAIAGAANSDGVSSTEARVCVPEDAACEADLCGTEGLFTECILTKGAKQCPDGPYSVRHRLGTAPNLTCSACGCSLGATCTGTLTLYSDATCTGTSTTRPVNDTCVQSTGTSVGSYTYTGAVEALTCAPAGPSKPTLKMSNPQTVCCKG